ncbi:hypothetical protein E4T42_02941 [Aureobasidium subglaciale]|nr:hypothetical protein E4T42_02941 [Aureobasidium subglaciale]
MLIGLMSLGNHTLFVQFHPVGYMIVNVARTSENDVRPKPSSLKPCPERSRHQHTLQENDDIHILNPRITAMIAHLQLDNLQREEIEAISRQRDVQVFLLKRFG